MNVGESEGSKKGGGTVRQVRGEMEECARDEKYVVKLYVVKICRNTRVKHNVSCVIITIRNSAQRSRYTVQGGTFSVLYILSQYLK